jgi:hypothetical protein
VADLVVDLVGCLNRTSWIFFVIVVVISYRPGRVGGHCNRLIRARINLLVAMTMTVRITGSNWGSDSFGLAMVVGSSG